MCPNWQLNPQPRYVPKPGIELPTFWLYPFWDNTPTNWTTPARAMICILHCVPNTQSQIRFCHHIFGPLYPLLPVQPLPSGNHYTLVCVYEFQFYIPHTSEIIWFLAFSDWFILLSIILSRCIYVAHKWQYFIFSYGWAVLHCVYGPHLPYPVLCQRALWLFPCLGRCE